MQSVSPVGAGHSSPVRPSYGSTQPAASGDVGSASVGGSLAATGQVDASPVARLQDALVAWLQNAGLDPQSQRLMQLMIGLLILLALLASIQGGAGDGGQASDDLLSALAHSGREGNTNGLSPGVAAFAFEQTTTTTIYMASSDPYSANEAADGPRLDTIG